MLRELRITGLVTPRRSVDLAAKARSGPSVSI